MILVDAHADTLFAQGVEHQQDTLITPQRLKEGGVSLQVFALWTGGKGNQGPVQSYLEAMMGQRAWWTERGVAQVDDPAMAKEGTPQFMLSIEGGEPLEKDLASVRFWREQGVRMVALTWNHPNAIGFPAKGGSSQGLTAYGFQVVKEMQRLGMAADVSHLNEAGFYDLFKTDCPPMASHSCCRALCDHFRNLTDHQLRTMIQGGGYIGVNFYPDFLSADGQADADTIINHIDHICQLGGEKQVGFGSDYDGIDKTPSDLPHAGAFPRLLERMRERGFTPTQISDIAGNNFLSYYERIAP